MNLENIKQDYNELLSQLSDPELISDWERFEELSKKKKKLEKIISKQEQLAEILHKIEESKAMLKSETDKDLISLAESDVISLQNQEKTAKEELNSLLKDDDNSPKAHSVIIEIRAGTGGDEAAIFAGDLYRMYCRYAETQGWKMNLLDSHPADLGGVKEIIFELTGNAYEKMKYEGGVHRVQRIPKTEKAGRIHTSTASVAVLMKPKPSEIKIKAQDLKIDIAKASGPGGQNVNKRMTAVRLTHLPTGIMVKSMTERSLPQNKENAMSILAAKLLEIQESKDLAKEKDKRKSQIGTAKRVEKIRTYNFPQDRITDHRIKKSWHDIEGIMDGNMDKVIEAMQKADN
ncbi:MAG: peptide chain release factor 1 [Phycisphaerae bacterium]|nr:peptide chain release factor 1 [Phycisphaerae bacterium]